jgi:hypothetical protein
VSTTEELLERKSSGSGLENRKYGRWGFRRADYSTPLYPQKARTNFDDIRRSLDRYSSLADSGHGFSLMIITLKIWRKIYTIRTGI